MKQPPRSSPRHPARNLRGSPRTSGATHGNPTSEHRRWTVPIEQSRTSSKNESARRTASREVSAHDGATVHSFPKTLPSGACSTTSRCTSLPCNIPRREGGAGRNVNGHCEEWPRTTPESSPTGAWVSNPTAKGWLVTRPSVRVSTEQKRLPSWFLDRTPLKTPHASPTGSAGHRT